MGCGSNRRAAGSNNRDSDQWVRTKMEQVSPDFRAEDLEKIEAELRTVKSSTVPSNQRPYKKMDSLLRSNQEVPAWLAESVRLLYQNNQFGDTLFERLVDLGYDEHNITNPTLPYEERRPQISMLDFVVGRDEEDMSEDYPPNDSDDADDEASEAEETRSESETSSQDLSASSDSFLAGQSQNDDSDGDDDDGSAAPNPGPRRSARPSQLRVSFEELTAIPRVTPPSEGSESIKEESGLDSSPRSIKVEDVAMGTAHASQMMGGGFPTATNNRFQCPRSSSESDDTDPDLVDDDVKLEDGAEAMPNTTAPGGTIASHTHMLMNGRLDRGGRSESPEAMVDPPTIVSPPGPRLGPMHEHVTLAIPRPVSNSTSFMNCMSQDENRLPEASWEDEYMFVREYSTFPCENEDSDERSQQTRSKQATMSPTGNGSPVRLQGSYGERPARASGLFNGQNRTGHGDRAAASGSFWNTEVVNQQTGTSQVPVQASSTMSQFPANPVGEVKRKPGRPPGSGLARDKKLLEPTRVSKRLRQRSTSPPMLQVSQDNTVKFQQAAGNVDSTTFGSNVRGPDAPTQSTATRKRGRPAGSTEASLLVRRLHADMTKKETFSAAEASPSKRPRTEGW